MHRHLANGSHGVTRLTLEVAAALGDDLMRKVFKIDSSITKFDLADIIKREFKEYQTEIISESMYLKEKQTVTKKKPQHGYWAKAYEIVGVEEAGKDENELIRVDQFWLKVIFELRIFQENGITIISLICLFLIKLLFISFDS